MNEYRVFFLQAWKKHLQGSKLSDLESQVRDVLLLYPQYISELNQDKTYPLEDNPYIQMGLHLTVWDQVRTNRPEGIRPWFLEACVANSQKEVEQLMLMVLRQTVYVSYQAGNLPCEQKYLNILKNSAKIKNSVIIK